MSEKSNEKEKAPLLQNHSNFPPTPAGQKRKRSDEAKKPDVKKSKIMDPLNLTDIDLDKQKRLLSKYTSDLMVARINLSDKLMALDKFKNDLDKADSEGTDPSIYQKYQSYVEGLEEAGKKVAAIKKILSKVEKISNIALPLQASVQAKAEWTRLKKQAGKVYADKDIQELFDDYGQDAAVLAQDAVKNTNLWAMITPPRPRKAGEMFGRPHFFGFSLRRVPHLRGFYLAERENLGQLANTAAVSLKDELSAPQLASPTKALPETKIASASSLEQNRLKLLASMQQFDSIYKNLYASCKNLNEAMVQYNARKASGEDLSLCAPNFLDSMIAVLQYLDQYSTGLDNLEKELLLVRRSVSSSSSSSSFFASIDSLESAKAELVEKINPFYAVVSECLNDLRLDLQDGSFPRQKVSEASDSSARIKIISGLDVYDKEDDGDMLAFIQKRMQEPLHPAMAPGL